MKKVIFMIGIIAVIMWGCTQSPQKSTTKATGSNAQFAGLIEKAKAAFNPLPTSVDNPDNPVTAEKVLLGQTLYFDNRLSKNGNISCNSCHNLNTYGVDNEPTSTGDGGLKGGRNSPTVLNAAFHFAQFWDGRAKDVEEQAGGPIMNPIEMSMPDQNFVLKRIEGIKGYKAMFDAAFPGEKQPINYGNIQKSIGAFERKLITPSRFDEYLAGNENALNEQEKQGLLTFINTGCTACHSGASIGGNMYQKFGITGNYWDLTRSTKVDEGRFQVTKNESDKYFFKVPGLRNVEKTYPYFHDGSINSLDEAVRIMAKLQLGKDLTPQEIQDIVTFMKTLNGTVPEQYAKKPAMPV